MYSTDNGAEVMTWPDGGTTPFAGEKNTQWEGGYRVPTLIRWPGVIEPGTRINNIASHEDMLPTLVAAAGSGDIKERLLDGGVRAFVLVPAQSFVANWLSSFEQFPPRQKPGSFSLSQVMDKLTEASSN